MPCMAYDVESLVFWASFLPAVGLDVTSLSELSCHLAQSQQHKLSEDFSHAYRSALVLDLRV